MSMPLATFSPFFLSERFFGRHFLLSRRQNSRFGHRASSLRNRLAHFRRVLCQNHFIGFSKQFRQFLASHCFSRLQRHPLRPRQVRRRNNVLRSEEHTSELQSHSDLVCRLLLEKKKKNR